MSDRREAAATIGRALLIPTGEALAAVDAIVDLAVAEAVTRCNIHMKEAREAIGANVSETLVDACTRVRKEQALYRRAAPYAPSSDRAVQFLIDEIESLRSALAR